MNKFTATLVTAETKNKVIELRKALNLDEKTLMTFIVDLVSDGTAYADLVLRATEHNEVEATIKAEKRKAAYEALKERLKAERAEARAARKLAKAAAKAELEKAAADKPKKARKPKSVKAAITELVGETAPTVTETTEVTA